MHNALLVITDVRICGYACYYCLPEWRTLFLRLLALPSISLLPSTFCLSLFHWFSVLCVETCSKTSVHVSTPSLHSVLICAWDIVACHHLDLLHRHMFLYLLLAMGHFPVFYTIASLYNGFVDKIYSTYIKAIVCNQVLFMKCV